MGRSTSALAGAKPRFRASSMIVTPPNVLVTERKSVTVPFLPPEPLTGVSGSLRESIASERAKIDTSTQRPSYYDEIADMSRDAAGFAHEGGYRVRLEPVPGGDPDAPLSRPAPAMPTDEGKQVRRSRKDDDEALLAAMRAAGFPVVAIDAKTRIAWSDFVAAKRVEAGL